MKEYAKKAENTSRTIQSNSKASKQASIGEILQAKATQLNAFAYAQGIAQMQLGEIEAEDFRKSHSTYPTIANWAINIGNDWSDAKSIYDFIVLNIATSNEIYDLINTTRNIFPATTIPLIDAIVKASPPGASTINDLIAFMPRLNGKGTIAEATTLITAALLIAGTTIPHIDAMVTASPMGVSTTSQLTTFMPHLNGKGTIAEATALITAAIAGATIPQINAMVTAAFMHMNMIAELTTLINRNNVTNTAVRVQQLLVNLNPQTFVRYQQIVGTLIFFHHPLPLGPLPPDVVTSNPSRVMFKNWGHIANRHTFENFNFAGANILQGFYPSGSTYANLRAIIHPIINGLTIFQRNTIQSGVPVTAGGYQMGNHGGQWIITIFPTTAAVIQIYRDEILALQNLR